MSDFSATQDPADFTAKEVVEYLENADLTADEFNAIQEWERNGKNRATILRVEYTNGEEESEDEGFDLSDLQEIEPAEMAKAPRTGRISKPNPLDPYMEKSYNEEKAFSKVLENDRVKDFVSKVRRSATRHGWGSKVRLMEWNGTEGTTVLKSDQVSSTGQTLVQFQAVDKRERETTEDNPTDDETAENTNYEYAN